LAVAALSRTSSHPSPEPVAMAVPALNFWTESVMAMVTAATRAAIDLGESVWARAIQAAVGAAKLVVTTGGPVGNRPERPGVVRASLTCAHHHRRADPGWDLDERGGRWRGEVGAQDGGPDGHWHGVRRSDCLPL